MERRHYIAVAEALRLARPQHHQFQDVASWERTVIKVAGYFNNYANFKRDKFLIACNYYGNQ